MANNNPNTQGLKAPFSKENQPDNRGRKPSKLRKYIKENNLSSSDLSAMVKFVLPLNQDELKKVISDEKVPFVMRLFIKSMMDDMKRGKLTNTMNLFDRAFGKPVARQEIREFDLPKLISLGTLDTGADDSTED